MGRLPIRVSTPEETNMTARIAFVVAAAAGLLAAAHAADAPATASATITPLSITALGNNTFMVRDPLALTFSDGAPAFTVPAGFITELTSMPKAARWWNGKSDLSMAPALLHDYLYWYQPCTQEEADAVLYHAMTAVGASRSAAAAAWQANRSAGAAVFKKNAERRRGGEVRTVTAAYAQTVVQSSNFSPGETLDSALRKAQGAAGVVKSESASPAVKLTCARLQYQCEVCRDQAARKNAPKTRVAKDRTP
jgi:hypothetical protein